ncbi:MAG TPA: SAM-dependent methyltransferase [Verrucomicrobiae bacterium]|nr:SAM-dependent methyltransferase [Verrucomicrobiae bacterium]
MSPLEELLAAEIEREGPISFQRFMETALYHPQFGYYRSSRDPFGKAGDFYTATQLQPVFGILMASHIRELYRRMGAPADFTVVDLGAGRQEMADAFSEWRYVPVDFGAQNLPEHFRGVVFSNEFFDALPVEVVQYQQNRFHRQCVGYTGGRFHWCNGGDPSPAVERYLRRFFPAPEEGRWYEANLDALEWLRRIADALDSGFVFSIDYGFTRLESIRFPAGTLMGYQRHTAREQILEDPGARDITAHVNFTALREFGEEIGLRTERFETLAQSILAAGERDQFAGVLTDASPSAVPPPENRRLGQLKTLLFGMGETFRVLLQSKEEP